MIKRDETDKTNQIDTRAMRYERRRARALGGVRAFHLFSSSKGVGKIGGNGPQVVGGK
jgi:hypothetical protein